MAENTKNRLTRMLLSKSRRAQYAKIFAILGACVAIAVAVVLHQNGVAMTHEEQVLTCPVTGTVAHTHDQSCYDEDGNLVCPLPEIELHEHTDECYEDVKELTCGQEESDEHKHTDECYTVVKELTCGKEESDEHQHTDECYTPKRELVCEKEEVTEEHVHGPGCFTTVTVPNDEDEPEADATAQDDAEKKAEDAKDDSDKDKADDKDAKSESDKAEGQDAKDVAEKDKAEDAKAADTKTEKSESDKDKDKAEDNKNADVAMPAQSFTEKIEDADGKVILQVEVEAPEGAFPANTTMQVKAIDAKDVEGAVDEAVAKKTEEKVSDIQAVDIKFFDESGKEIKPAQEITVRFISDIIAKNEKSYVVHVNDDGKGDVVDSLSDEELAKRNQQSADDAVSIDAKEFSPYVLVAVSLQHTLTASDGNKYTVTVDCPAEANIPENAELQVTEIVEGAEGYDAYLKEVKDNIKDKVTFARFFDIKIVADGEEIQPSAPVGVKVELSGKAEDAKAVEDAEEAKAVHFTSDNKVEVIDATLDQNTVSFKAEGFSTYAVVGTQLVTEFTLPGSDDIYEVTVTYGEDAKIPEGASLSVTALASDSDEYKTAKEAVVADKKAKDKSFDVVDLGFAALDITILDAAGNKVEPAEGAEVKVFIKLKSLPKGINEETLNETLEFQHLNETSGTPKVETVAEAKDVTVGKGTAEAEFTVTSFSTFTLTWGENKEHSATIHYGIRNTDTDEFEDFSTEKITTLDATANTVDLNVTFADYSWIGATYKANDSTDEVSINPARLTKADDGYQVTTVTYDDEDNPVTSTVNIADGSDIYVYYGVKQSHGESPENVNGPITSKVVSDNSDGTYKIKLDLESPVTTETSSVGANVLIVFDRTNSMRNPIDGADNRMAAAKSAVATLVNILSTGENAGNDIDYSLVSFYRTADSIHAWGNDAISGRPTWTKNATVFNSFIQALDYPDWGHTGTNWEAGLYQARQALNSKDNDKTYVIFMTDGEPNRRGTSTNTSSANTATAISYALTQAKAIAGTSNVALYGVFCGSDSGYNNLADLITDAGGVGTINGTNNSGLQSAFSNIAYSIIESMGSSGVSIDDGVTTLSSVSSAVAGEAGGYEYFISYKLNVNGNTGSYTDINKQSQTVSINDPGVYTKTVNGQPVYYYKTTWADAPGATYTADNGVTWDLSSKGTLPADTIFTVTFTVWPSQEAYDLIADLNNGVRDYDPLPQNIKDQIAGSKEEGYTMITNTHLLTTFTNGGNTYTDRSQWKDKDMPLPTKMITVRKIWNNPVDTHVGDDDEDNPSVQLNLTKDGEKYLYGANAITVAPPANDPNSLTWVSTEDIYISTGSIKQNTTTKKYDVLEDGHDYSISEPETFSYFWDLNADTYHPMVINGVSHLLKLKEDATGTDGVDYYTINDKKYVLSDGEGNNVLEATNDRRSNLNLSKTIHDASIDQGADKDTLFEYTAKVNNPTGVSGSENNIDSDYYVWFSVWDDNKTYTDDSDNNPHLVRDLVVSDNVIPATNDSGATTGYYYAPKGTAFTFKIKEGWNLRFLNLAKESTYTIVESDAGAGWEFEKAEGSAIKYISKTEKVNEGYNLNADTATIEGSIPASNHEYYVALTNKYEPTGNQLLVQKEWNSGDFVTTHGPVMVALYKNNAIVEGSVKTITAPATSVTYTGISSLEGLKIREVVATTSGEGENASTSYTVVNTNGMIAVSGETTKLGTDATDTYVVTYATGTASTTEDGTSRTDTITNTMPQLIVNKQDMSNKQLSSAKFKLTGEDGNTALTGYSEITSSNAPAGNLLNGIYLSNGTYYLVETEAPDGYNKLDYKVKIEVTDSGINASTEPSTQYNLSDETLEDPLKYTFSVMNSTGKELPNTGGVGTATIYTTGAVLIAIAAVGLVANKRRNDL